MGLFRDITTLALDALATKLRSAPNPGSLYPSGGISQGIPYGGPLTFPGWPDRTGREVLNEEAKIRMALQSEWVYSDIQLIAQELATIELEVYERQEGDEEPLQVINHELELLWANPNPHMGTAFVVMMATWWLMMRGECYLFFAPGDNGPAEIWPIPSSMMEPVEDAIDFISGYWFRSKPTAKPTFIPAEYICYTWFPHPLNPRRGLAPLVAAMLSLKTDRAQGSWNEGVFAKDNAIPVNMVVANKDMTTQDFNRLKREMVEFYGGGQQRTMFTRSGDIDIKVISQAHKDMEFLASRQFNRDAIDRAFGIPNGFWNASATEANQRGAKAVVIENAVWPKAVLIAQNLTTQIARRWYGEQYIVRFKDIRPRNVELEIREREANKDTWTLNELRKAQNKEPLKGWLWDNVPASVALNLYSIAMGNSMELPTPEAPPALSGPPGEPAATPEADRAQARDDALEDTDDAPQDDPADVDMKRWERKAIKAVRAGRPASVRFESEAIPVELTALISDSLAHAQSPAEVRDAFKAIPLSDQEKALVAALTPIFTRLGQQSVDQILNNKEVDLSSFDRDTQAAILAALTQVMLEQATMLAEEIGPDFDPAEFTTAASAWAQTYTYNLVTGITTTTRKVLVNVIGRYLSTPGMTRAELEAALLPAFGAKRVEAIAITEVTRADVMATNSYMELLAAAGIEMERIWRTNADDRVCAICGPKNGKPESFWFVDFPNGPPGHIRCRCRLTLRLKKKG